MARRRVGFLQSFKIARKAGLEADDPSGGIGAFFSSIIFGFWWWIVGVPREDE
jgi:hypothetical protein